MSCFPNNGKYKGIIYSSSNCIVFPYSITSDTDVAYIVFFIKSPYDNNTLFSKEIRGLLLVC